MLGNGDLKDGIKGKTVWRENDDRMGQTISPAIGEAEVEGYLKEEVRKMSEEELFQLVLKAAEEAARLEEESPERDEN